MNALPAGRVKILGAVVPQPCAMEQAAGPILPRDLNYPVFLMQFHLGSGEGGKGKRVGREREGKWGNGVSENLRELQIGNAVFRLLTRKDSEKTFKDYNIRKAEQK